MEWETTSTPYVVNLANQLFHTLEESPKRKTTKILNLQLQQIKAPKQKQNPPIFLLLLQRARALEKRLLQIQVLHVPSVPPTAFPTSSQFSKKKLQGTTGALPNAPS